MTVTFKGPDGLGFYYTFFNGKRIDILPAKSHYVAFVAGDQIGSAQTFEGAAEMALTHKERKTFWQRLFG